MQDKPGAQKDRMTGYGKGTKEPNKRTLSSWSCSNLSSRINNLLLEYNPKNKVNIHESTVLETIYIYIHTHKHTHIYICIVKNKYISWVEES